MQSVRCAYDWAQYRLSLPGIAWIYKDDAPKQCALHVGQKTTSFREPNPIGWREASARLQDHALERLVSTIKERAHSEQMATISIYDKVDLERRPTLKFGDRCPSPIVRVGTMGQPWPTWQLPNVQTIVLVLSGPLDQLNAILSLLHPLDRYRTPSAIGSAIGGALSRPIWHPHTGGSSQPPRSKPLGGLNRAIVVL